MVSTALRVTGTAAGSGTIRGDEYDVDAKRQAITNTCASTRFSSFITPRPLFSTLTLSYSSSFFTLPYTRRHRTHHVIFLIDILLVAPFSLRYFPKPAQQSHPQECTAALVPQQLQLHQACTSAPRAHASVPVWRTATAPSSPSTYTAPRAQTSIPVLGATGTPSTPRVHAAPMKVCC